MNQQHFWNNTPTPLQKVEAPFLSALSINLYIKRDDLIHSEIIGNKWRKLKYNLLYAKAQNYKTLLTFGGAFSNHIAAMAAAGKLLDFETVGIIRGEELNSTSNAVLEKAEQNGMKFIFVSREAYQNKENLAKHYGHGCYVLPEGGTNTLAAEGSAETYNEIVAQLSHSPDFIALPIGTGGTFAGVCARALFSSRILGFCVLKNGQYLVPEINKIITKISDFNKTNYEIFWDFHHGGYAKITPELMNFIVDFEELTAIKLEPIYSGKMLFGLYEIIKQFPFEFKNKTIVAVHTGGVR